MHPLPKTLVECTKQQGEFLGSGMRSFCAISHPNLVSHHRFFCVGQRGWRQPEGSIKIRRRISFISRGVGTHSTPHTSRLKSERTHTRAFPTLSKFENLLLLRSDKNGPRLASHANLPPALASETDVQIFEMKNT